MLRQVLLEIPEPNQFQQIASANGVELEMEDCRSFNSKGMTMLFGARGERRSVDGFLAGLRKLEGVRHVYETEVAPSRTLVLAVIDRPLPCSASVDTPVICLQCPFNSHSSNAAWKILVRRSEDLREVLDRLERSGVKPVVKEISEVSQQEELTGRQKAILSIAVSMGYFDFPRKISLTALSKAVGVKPSTLSEILRSAERKILQSEVEGGYDRGTQHVLPQNLFG